MTFLETLPLFYLNFFLYNRQFLNDEFFRFYHSEIKTFSFWHHVYNFFFFICVLCWLSSLETQRHEILSSPYFEVAPFEEQFQSLWKPSDIKIVISRRCQKTILKTMPLDDPGPIAVGASLRVPPQQVHPCGSHLILLVSDRCPPINHQ